MHLYKEQRPWGSFEQFTLNEPSTVKLLHVNSRQRTSLQCHNNRSEFWKIVYGKVKVTLGNETKMLSREDTLFIPAKSIHRVEGIEDSTILEISFGIFDEKDIERIEDDYVRKETA